MPSTHYLIAGAGIIGLATASELRKRFPKSKITILEKEIDVGFHASGRNSGVLHSGIYYGPGTVKAKVCAEGARRMMEFARAYGIAYRQEGKVIIPTCEAELSSLDRLMDNARANGIAAELQTAEQIKEREPHAHPHKKGIYCPSVAVIDSKAVVKKLAEVLQKQGIEICFEEEVIDVSPKSQEVVTKKETRSYDYFVNCGGAFADRIAAFFRVGEDYSLVPFKGFYYQLSQKSSTLVNCSIYPVPNAEMPFLGVHFTRVINGDIHIGPTATPAFGRENYGLFAGAYFKEALSIFCQLSKMYFGSDPAFRKLVHHEMMNYWKPFYVSQAQKLIPDVTVNDFEPCDKVGIRPQLVNLKTKKLEMDYVIEAASHSIHVLNAISPAFTSAFAFSEYLVDQIESH